MNRIPTHLSLTWLQDSSDLSLKYNNRNLGCRVSPTGAAADPRPPFVTFVHYDNYHLFYHDQFNQNVLRYFFTLFDVILHNEMSIFEILCTNL